MTHLIKTQEDFYINPDYITKAYLGLYMLGKENNIYELHNVVYVEVAHSGDDQRGFGGPYALFMGNEHYEIDGLGQRLMNENYDMALFEQDKVNLLAELESFLKEIDLF